MGAGIGSGLRGMAAIALRYGWLPFRELIQDPDFPAMLKRHWVEGQVHKEALPHNPDLQWYVNEDDAGRYRVWAAHDGTRLVGYLGLFIHPHPNSRNVIGAIQDAINLLPDYRGHLWSFLKSCEKALPATGAEYWAMLDRPAGSLAALYLRMGFADIEHVYGKPLT